MIFMLPLGTDEWPVAVAGVGRAARPDPVPGRSGAVRRHG